MSYTFIGLQINTVYEFNIRAKYSDGSSSVSHWAKEVLITTSGVPGPFLVNAVPFGCSAKLSWNVPSSDGCPITRYTIHYRDKRNGWNMINLKRSNVSGYRLWLNCSKNYDIMVIAWNQQGHNHYSEKSLESIRTERGKPFKPSTTKVEPKECGEVEVSWGPPSFDSGGGLVTDFQVQMRKQGGNWRNCSNFLPNNTCLFHGLLIDKNDARIDVRLRAANKKGFSEWTNDKAPISRPDPPEIESKGSIVPGRNVTITWSAPEDNNCYIFMYSVHFRVVQPLVKSWSQINISGVTSYQLQLQYSKQYEFIIAAWNTLGRSENSAAWKVRTAQDYDPLGFSPVCYSFNLICHAINVISSIHLKSIVTRNGNATVVYRKLTLCFFIPLLCFIQLIDRPGSPEIFDRKVSGCNITLGWTSPKSTGCPILFYTISYRKKGLNDDDTWVNVNVNVTDEGVKQTELILNCFTTYEFQARAWNELGGGELSSLQSATTDGLTSLQGGRESYLRDSPPLELVNLITPIVAGVVVLIALVLTIRVWYYYRKRSSKQDKRTVKDVHVLEQCEIHPLRTEFVEDLGEGAFGKVHKATLKNGLDFI
ncbi:unnamed protein product [Pocillopora meandrina]|uniref:Fibronectin type-III domain-containing protein n=1 Tax=Pocillopora meandrina TaxID=46732 RepID=A0AAU9W377_9CNID|nr:unnamed protein product [Pocillopora meandrina]